MEVVVVVVHAKWGGGDSMGEEMLVVVVHTG